MWSIWKQHKVVLLKRILNRVFPLTYSMAYTPLRRMCFVFYLVLGIYIRSARGQDDPLANFGDTIQVLGQVSLCSNADPYFD